MGIKKQITKDYPNRMGGMSGPGGFNRGGLSGDRPFIRRDRPGGFKGYEEGGNNDYSGGYQGGHYRGPDMGG